MNIRKRMRFEVTVYKGEEMGNNRRRHLKGIKLRRKRKVQCIKKFTSVKYGKMKINRRRETW